MRYAPSLFDDVDLEQTLGPTELNARVTHSVGFFSLFAAPHSAPDMCACPGVADKTDGDETCTVTFHCERFVIDSQGQSDDPGRCIRSMHGRIEDSSVGRGWRVRDSLIDPHPWIPT